MKKTITLGYKDNPTVTLFKGHVTAKAFNEAHQKEGWHGDKIRKSDLSFEYWKPLKRGWKKSTISDRHAEAVTVMYW